MIIKNPSLTCLDQDHLLKVSRQRLRRDSFDAGESVHRKQFLDHPVAEGPDVLCVPVVDRVHVPIMVGLGGEKLHGPHQIKSIRRADIDWTVKLTRSLDQRVRIIYVLDHFEDRHYVRFEPMQVCRLIELPPKYSNAVRLTIADVNRIRVDAEHLRTSVPDCLEEKSLAAANIQQLFFFDINSG